MKQKVESSKVEKMNFEKLSFPTVHCTCVDFC